MIAFLIAVLVAIGSGAQTIELPQQGADPGYTVIEFTAPQCPNRDDEPCYVIVAPDFTVEVGP